MMPGRRAVWIGLGLGVAAAAGCRATAGHQTESPRATAASGSDGGDPGGASSGITAVATFSILGDLVRNVAGNAIDLKVLVGPDGDPHAFEPTPADTVAIAGSDLIFENGLGLEPWMDDLYESSGSAARRVVVTGGVTPRSIGPGEFDPHMWQDVTAAARMVEVIRDSFESADPANAASYQANAEAYLQQLAALDAQIAERAASVGPNHRKLVTSHDALGYFASRYGFEIVATALGTTATGSTDPSARDIARVVDQIRAAGVPAIFAENVARSDLMERVAQEAGVVLVDTLYTDALGEPGSAGATYVGMMSFNIDQIVGARSP